MYDALPFQSDMVLTLIHTAGARVWITLSGCQWLYT